MISNGFDERSVIMFVVAKVVHRLINQLKGRLVKTDKLGNIQLLTPPCDRELPGIPWGAPGSCTLGFVGDGSEHLGERPYSLEAYQGDSFGVVPDDHVFAVVSN